MIDGKRIGLVTDSSPRFHRSDSLSVVSRQSILSILLLCLTLFVGVGNVWGAVPSGWTQVTALNGMSAGDKIIIVTNNGNNYFNGTQSSGHLQVTALSASAPASASADGVIELVSTSTSNTYKLKLVSTNKYVTASKANSGGGVVTSNSDSYGWTFSSGFNARYQESGKQAYLRSYNNGSFRTYGNQSGDAFKIYKYSSSVAVSSVSVSPTSKSIVIGETFTVTPTVLPANATNKDIAWSSSATGKATVTSAGLVTGVDAGTANIKATSDADATKNATCAVTVYTVTIQKKDEAGNTISVSGVTATATGRALSASATAASKYVFKGWKYGTAAGTSIASTSSANTTLNGTPSGNVTVIAEFYAPLTATWMVAGSEWTGKGEQTTFARGSHVSALPTAPNPNNSEGCGDKFVGWTTVEEYAHGSSPLYTSASQFPNATTDQVFYAVFADYDE